MTAIQLTGVVENGAPWYEPTVPQTPEVAISVWRGASTSIGLRVVTRDGLPVDLGADPETRVVFSVKKNTAFFEYAFQTDAQILAPASDGRAVFLIPPEAFSLQDPGSFVYDIWMLRTLGSVAERIPVVPTSPFRLLPSALNAPL